MCTFSYINKKQTRTSSFLPGSSSVLPIAISMSCASFYMEKLLPEGRRVCSVAFHLLLPFCKGI